MKGLWQILFRNAANPPFVANDVVKVFYDTATNAFSLTKNGAALGTGPTLTEPTFTRYSRIGPPEITVNYSVSPIDDSGNVDLSRPDVQYCDGTTLVQFAFAKPFPYGSRIDNLNHSSCSISNVCDIAFIGTPQIVRPSDLGTPDGSIQVNASSSLGAVRFALSDIAYVDMTNTSGLFTSLAAGTYTVYARDINGCRAVVTVNLISLNNYFVRWRHEYYDLKGYRTVTDILQLDYAGSIVDIVGTEEPFILRLRGEGKSLFDSILSTEATLNLLSETNYQYLDLFTQNEREFLIKHSKDTGRVIPGGTVANITIPTLNTWIGRTVSGADWTTGIANPAVTIVPLTATIPSSSSEIIYTDYTFLVGYEYTITLNYTYGINSGSSSIRNAFLRIHDDLFNNIFSTNQSANIGANTISITFTATADCKKIGFRFSASGSATITLTGASGTEKTPSGVNIPVGLELKWTGYVTPGLHQEEYYRATNYSLSTNATDQLTLLAEIPYTDDAGNLYTGDQKLIKVIAQVLAKTDLRLPIHVACDIYENEHSTDISADPLDQTYINVETTFRNEDGEPKNCLEVITDILEIFGARLYQGDGAWKVESIYLKTATSYNYRIFDQDGDYVSNGTFSPLIENVDWLDRTPSLEIISALGKISVIYDLNKNKWGFKNGGFEEFVRPDLLPGFIQSYPGWTLINNGNTASYARITETNTESLLSGNDSPYSMYIVSRADNDTAKNEDAYILSEPVPVIYSGADGIKFSFDFNPRVSSAAPNDLLPSFVKFKYSLEFDGYFLQADGGWRTEAEYEWIEVVVPSGKINQWNKIEVQTLCPPTNTQTQSTYQLRIMHGLAFGDTWVYDNYTDIRAIPTVKLPAGYVITYFSATPSGLGSITNIFRWYQLTVDDSAESGVDIIKPNDYSATAPENKVNWFLEESITARTGGRVEGLDILPKNVRVGYFDNVNLEFLPLGEVSPEEKEYVLVNNALYKNTLEVPVFIGDAPADISNSRYVYNNYLKHADGTPTYGWSRKGFNEFQPILSLLVKQYMEQYRKPKFKISGSFQADGYVGFNNTFKDGLRYFIPMGMEILDRSAQYSVELHEVDVTGSDTLNPFGPAEFETQEFGSDYDI